MTWQKITIEELKRHLANGLSHEDIATRHGMVTESVKCLIRKHIRKGKDGSQVEKDLSDVSDKSIIAKINAAGSHCSEKVDNEFEPQANDCFVATGAPVGSEEKIEILRQRAQEGLPLWHENDETQAAPIRESNSKKYVTRESSKEPVSVKSDGRRTLKMGWDR